jgi:hypothetical protein
MIVETQQFDPAWLVLAIYLDILCYCIKRFFTEKRVGPKIEEFQAFTAIHSLESNTKMATIKFVHMQKTCWRVSEIRAMFHSEAQESPRALTTKTKKRRKKKT